MVLMLFSGVYCKGGNEIYNCPPNVQARYKKLVGQADTFIMYNRSCGTCLRGTPYLVYFIYKKDSKIMAEVYSWKSPIYGKKGKCVLKQRLKLNERRIFFDFAIKNYDSLSKEAMNQKPFMKYTRYVDGNGKEFFMPKNENIQLQGSFIEYQIILKEKDLTGRVFGGRNVKKVESVLPVTGEMMRLFHDFYSKYSKENIVDDVD
jgi:hypothetical protein